MSRNNTILLRAVRRGPPWKGVDGECWWVADRPGDVIQREQWNNRIMEWWSGGIINI